MRRWRAPFLAPARLLRLLAAACAAFAAGVLHLHDQTALNLHPIRKWHTTKRSHQINHQILFSFRVYFPVLCELLKTIQKASLIVPPGLSLARRQGVLAMGWSFRSDGWYLQISAFPRGQPHNTAPAATARAACVGVRAADFLHELLLGHVFCDIFVPVAISQFPRAHLRR